MPTQVRIFNRPRSLDQTLAETISSSSVPRTIPEFPDTTSAITTTHRERSESCPKLTSNGTNGVHGVKGANGVNGTNGTHRMLGINGVNGTNGHAHQRPNGVNRNAYMGVYDDTPREGGVTFASQDQLPQLPIPDLESTAQKYLTALKPLQSVREHAETRHAIAEFLKQDGPELQEKLHKYAQSKTSYIEQFCKSEYEPSPGGMD